MQTVRLWIPPTQQLLLIGQHQDRRKRGERRDLQLKYSYHLCTYYVLSVHNKDGTTKLIEELSTQGDKDEVERLLTEEVRSVCFCAPSSWLIKQKADPNATTPSGVPCLSLAALNGHHHCLQTLVTHKANINGQSKRYEILMKVMI